MVYAMDSGLPLQCRFTSHGCITAVLAIRGNYLLFHRFVLEFTLELITVKNLGCQFLL